MAKKTKDYLGSFCIRSGLYNADCLRLVSLRHLSLLKKKKMKKHTQIQLDFCKKSKTWAVKNLGKIIFSVTFNIQFTAYNGNYDTWRWKSKRFRDIT